jgi:hypothetical protein
MWFHTALREKFCFCSVICKLSAKVIQNKVVHFYFSAKGAKASSVSELAAKAHD